MFKKTADTITQEPVWIQFNATVRHRWMPWRKLVVSKRYAIYPLTLGSLIRISKLLLSIEPELFNLDKNLINVTYEAALQHGRILAEVIAIAFTNSKEGPSKELTDLIQDNVTPTDLQRIFTVVLEQMNISNFMSSIISIRGINLLKEMNPTEQGSRKVASGEQLED